MKIKDLESKGFVGLQYPSALRDKVGKAMELWRSFCELPVESRAGLPYSNSADGVGYEFKDGKGRNADKKENFDVTTKGVVWLEENLSQVAEAGPSALAFARSATDLVLEIKPLIVEFAHEVEREYGLVGFAKEVSESEAGFFLRFIHYYGNAEVGEETANAHVDQSGFTLHLFESDPGLQCLEYDGDWIPMPVSEEETVIVTAMQLQLRSKGRLRALCHRVVADENTAVGGRYSAVCFIQMRDTQKYDKEKGGRLQEKKPGFNYDMPDSEFVELFK